MTRYFILAGLEETARKRIRDAVGTHNNSFHVTNTLRETLEQVRQLEPSVLFTAANLADGNGYDLCRQIKELHQMVHIGVALVGKPDEAYDQTFGLMTGVDFFIDREMDEERLSELTIDLAEKMEEKSPPAKRHSALWKKSVANGPAPPPPTPREKPTPPPAPVSTPPRPPAEQPADPLRDFFLEEEAVARQSMTPVEAEAPEKDRPAWHQGFDRVSEAASKDIARYVEQWVQFHYGQRVDESMRLEVDRTIRPMIRTIIQNNLRKATE
jgi:CheY-like chemotaxis protein